MLQLTTQSKKIQSGFSLIELAVSLTVIALLISIISVGSSLSKQATIHKTISQFTQYQAAMVNFKDKYGYMPGDLPNAFSFWPTCGGGVAATCNGNGNGLIPHLDEGLEVWEHMSLSGMVSENLRNATSWYAADNAIGTAVPQSPLKTISGYSAYSEGSCKGDALSIILGTYRTDGGNALNDGAMTPHDTYAIDLKIDDGNPMTGKFAAWRSQSNWSNNALCSTNAYNASCETTHSYILTDYTTSCAARITVFH